MMDLVYWSMALRAEREHEAAKHQFVARARAVLRQPEAPLRRDAVRTLAFETKRRATLAAACCMFGVSG